MSNNLSIVLWYVTMSLDGFIAGPGDGMNWVFKHAGPNPDICSSVSRAREAAGGKNVVLIGASIARQCIEAGLVDEILVHLAPNLLGDGVRFFGSSGCEPVDLQAVSVTRSGQVSNLRFRVPSKERE
jgi:dihydrofolate reductase